ncbi:MAG: amidohydrolase [Gemmatimonadetes bacterium]|nr:amidohydrolase [Gemmatimonadota bacterium]
MPHRFATAPLLFLLGAACAPAAPAADLVVFGKVWTGDSAAPLAQAVATRGDTVVAVGDSATIAKLVGPATRVLANPGGLVVPGFMDDHVHFLDGGFQLASVDLRDAESPEEFTRRLQAFAAERQPGEWITGGDWDHERWPGAPLPRREWIDSVTPNNPVFISRLDGHMGLANSLALKAAGLTRASREIPGGTIVRDARGEPTGVLKDEAMSPVYAVMPAPSEAQVDAALGRAMAHAASKGVTAVASVSAGWAQVAGLQRARSRGTLITRVTLFPALAAWRTVAESVAANGPGDDWLRLAGVKGFVDGSLGSTTALFFEPYSDDPTTSGLMVTPEDSLRRWIGAADSAGLQVVVHAIGERANALLLDIYDSVARAHGPRDRRFRIEHAQHLRPQEVARIASLGVVASMQPYHAADDGRWAGKRLGARVGDSYSFRSLLDAKAHLVFGSDWSVAPLDPLLGIHAAVTRRTLDGRNPDGWIPEQKISVEEALRAYTSENAWAVFAEGSRGVLRPGYRADLVLLSQDLLTMPPETLDQVEVVATVAGGRVVHERR